jgi:O-methyltransferase
VNGCIQKFHHNLQGFSWTTNFFLLRSGESGVKKRNGKSPFPFQRCMMPFYGLAKILFKRSIIMIPCMIADENKDVRKYKEANDYVRYRTLGLLVDIIKSNLKDADYSIAELGVFRGDFAARIQGEFQDKQLYLFDTFEGFSANDKLSDMKKGFIDENVGDFDSTSVDLVLKKMRFPDKCHICKGIFPLSVTAEHREIKWGFVSLDVDLYQPTLDGLRFFYPSLLPGGFIMIHDYNNPEFKGVKKAVEDFESEITTPSRAVPCTLCKVPIPDSYGSLIIIK